MELKAFALMPSAAVASALALASTSVIGPISAGAQEGGAGPEPPAATASCAAERCLAVSFTPELSAALGSSEPVDLATLAEGLQLDHRGEPLDVRLIAARYDNNRLVRYGVSERAAIGGEADAAIPDRLAALTDALAPATNRTVEITGFDGEAAAAPIPIMIQSFVGNVPPTYLVGEAGSALIPESSPAAAAAERSVGLFVLEPEAAELRDGAAVESFGVLVDLAFKRP